MSKIHKLAFCVTIKNRLSHLKSTIFENLNVCKKFDSVVIYLLNYSSTDNLKIWVYENQNQLLLNRTLFFISVEGYEYYNPSHAKNIVHRAAQADVLCNLDADNFLTPNYVRYLLDCFKFGENRCVSFISPDSKSNVYDGTCGRIAISKNNFTKIGGYNEAFKCYGFDDIDLLVRTKLADIEMLLAPEEDRLTILHSNKLRIENFEQKIIGKEAYFVNKKIHEFFINKYGYKANIGVKWGSGDLIDPFSEFRKPIKCLTLDRTIIKSQIISQLSAYKKEQPKISRIIIWGSIAKDEFGIYEKPYEGRTCSDVDVILVVDKDFKIPGDWSRIDYPSDFDIFTIGTLNVGEYVIMVDALVVPQKPDSICRLNQELDDFPIFQEIM